MSKLSCVTLTPLLLLLSIPLTVFATLTTTLAVSTLFIRALIVYVELAAVLLQNQLLPGSASPPTFTHKQIKDESCGIAELYQKGIQRSSTANVSSYGGSTTPRAPESSGFGLYGGEGPARDFEGVGGWKIPGPDDYDILWTSMNSRLVLPHATDGRRRNHHRSRTSCSLVTEPLPIASPTASKASTPTRNHESRSESPRASFRNRPPSKSTTSLDTANIGKILLHHKPSSSSGSSHSSVRTLHVNVTNG